MRTAIIMLGLVMGGVYADDLYYHGYHTRLLTMMAMSIARSF